MVKKTVRQKDAPGGGNNGSDITIRHPRDRLRIGTLPFWGLCFLGGGLAAVLVDLDHLPYFIFHVRWLYTPLNVFHFSPGRFLHPALFFVGCGVLACAGGLLLVMVLTDMYRALSVRYAVRVRQSVVKQVGSTPDRGASKHSIEVPGAKKKPTRAER